jgi:branched-chain amino acid transport system ATP-binding protein
MLSVNNLSCSYGDFKVVNSVTFHVNAGQWVSIVGGNGAGKTTLIHALAGIHRDKTGSVHFYGSRIDRLSSVEICNLGIAHVPEGRQIFPSLSVIDNLDLVGFARKQTLEYTKNKIDEVFDLFPQLKKQEKEPAGILSGGEQQMLAIGRCLIAEPKLILFDEPSLGLSPALVTELFSLLQKLQKSGIGIVLAEQHVEASLHYAQMAYVMEQGEIILSGSGQELLKNPQIKESFLG